MLKSNLIADSAIANANFESCVYNNDEEPPPSYYNSIFLPLFFNFKLFLKHALC